MQEREEQVDASVLPMPTSGIKSSIVWLGVIVLAVALAPWFSGGSGLVGRVITLAVLLLAALLIWRQGDQVRIGWRSPLTVLTVALLGWSTLSLVWSVNRYDSELWILGLVAAVGAFAVAYRINRAYRGPQLLQTAYLVVAALTSLYGFWIFASEDYNRLTSAFFWANPAAGFLLPAVIVGLDYLASRGARKLLLAIAVVNLVAFWLTQSRAATLVLLVASVVLLWRQRRNYRYLLIYSVSFIATFLLSTLCVHLWSATHHEATTTSVSGRFVAAASGDASSGSARLDFLESAGMIWLHHPFAGSGAGTYAAEHPRYQQHVVAASTDAHNWYAQVLAELGTMGGVIVALLLLAIAVGVRRGVTADAGLWPWAVGLVALIAHLGLDIDGQYPAILVLVALLVALIWRPQLGVSTPLRRPSFALIVLLVAALTVAQVGNQSRLLTDQADAAENVDDLVNAADLYGQAHQGLVYDPAVVNAEGISYFGLGQEGKGQVANFALALDRARTAERLAPTDAQNYQLEGRVLAVQGKNDAAIAAFRTALRLDPYNQPVYAQDLATALHEANRDQEALAVTRAMLAQYPDAVLGNRHNDPAVGRAIEQLWLFQQHLDAAVGDSAAAVVDRDQAARVAKSLQSSL